MKNLPISILTKNQTKMFSKICKIDGMNRLVEVTIRYDDSCGNGHNTISITGEVHVNTNPKPSQRDNPHCCGCIHDIISEFFPELRGYIKWHLCSSDGPMHYLANTLYLAGDRDYNGLRQGERRQLINGQTKLGVWELCLVNETGEKINSVYGYAWEDAETAPDVPEVSSYTRDCVQWVPVYRIGEGKVPDIDGARACAIWPNATLEQLQDKDQLLFRLPELMREFKQDVENLGFVY